MKMDFNSNNDGNCWEFCPDPERLIAQVFGLI